MGSQITMLTCAFAVSNLVASSILIVALVMNFKAGLDLHRNSRFKLADKNRRFINEILEFIDNGDPAIAERKAFDYMYQKIDMDDLITNSVDLEDTYFSYLRGFDSGVRLLAGMVEEQLENMEDE